MREMDTDHQTTAEIVEATGHQLGCVEWWLETALEADVDPVEIYALYIEQAASGFKRKDLGSCHCEVDGMGVAEMIKTLRKLGYKVTR